jgi:hypothetical protein
VPLAAKTASAASGTRAWLRRASARNGLAAPGPPGWAGEVGRGVTVVRGPEPG